MIQTLQREARQLTELLTQQRDLYRQLREMAKGQASAIETDQPEALLRVLAQRQRLITELNEINAHLEPFRSRWDELRQSLDAAERIRATDLVREVQDLLGEILRQDEADSQTLEHKSADARKQAASATVGQRVNAAYAVHRYAPAPRLIDRSDEGGDLA